MMRAEGIESLYAIVDTAADDRLYDLVLSCAEKECMFAGKIREPLNRASPWLVTLTTDDQLYRAWGEAGFDKAWGIFLRSYLGFREVRRHLRHFMQAMLPDGDIVLFRFYDPRIFRVYLPTCSPDELEKWFKGVSIFLAETAEADGFHEFRLYNGQLTDRGVPA